MHSKMLQVATKEKNAAEERMAKVQARLDEMQAQFDAAMAQKQLLEDDAAACQKKMDSAAALLHALAGKCDHLAATMCQLQCCRDPCFTHNSNESIPAICLCKTPDWLQRSWLSVLNGCYSSSVVLIH